MWRPRSSTSRSAIRTSTHRRSVVERDLLSARWVRGQPGRPSPEVETALEQRLMLFFTGLSHDSPTILREQRTSSERGDHDVIASLDRILELAHETLKC